MKINLDFKLQNLKGEDIADAHAGKIVGDALVQSTEGESIKFYDWGLSLYKGDTIDLDRADQETLEKFVKDSKVLTNLAKAQILPHLKRKDEKKKD